MTAETRGPELAAVIIFLLAFALTTVGLRCYTMGYLMKRFFAEDWIQQIFYVAYSVFALVSIHFGLGQHVVNVPTEQHPKALLFKWLGQVFYVIVAVLVKFVVGILLLRICSHQKWQRITIYSLLAVVGLFNAFYIFIVIFQCRPIEFYWFRYQTNSPVSGQCSHTKLATIPTYISLVLNVLSDFTLALLPISFVWHSKMEIRTKVSVVVVLAQYPRASLATIARIPYAKQLLSNPDYLYNFTDLAIWSTVEIGLGLAASSLATLKPLFRRLKILTTTRNASASIKQTGQSSTLHSRKLSTLSLKLQGRSKNFTEIGDCLGGESGIVKTTAWSVRPGEREAKDLEMGVMIGVGIEMGRNESVTSLHTVTGEDRDVAGRVEHFNYSLRRPQQSHVRSQSHIRSYYDRRWEEK
ncbi:cation-transporting ATPase 4 [Halenospora varia]|nr:cation-transporting ATPase 4 [Halenospora varia]